MTFTPPSLTVAVGTSTSQIKIQDTTLAGKSPDNTGAQFTASLVNSDLGVTAQTNGDPNTSADTASVSVSAQKIGSTQLIVKHVNDCVTIPVAIVKTALAPRIIFSTGFVASSLQNQTFTTVTPAPMATPSNGIPLGTYVYLNENSTSQVSVPLFVHYRLTDLNSRFNVYGSVGYAASLKQGTLFGVSMGLDQQAFITLAYHSQTINILCPNVNATTGLVYAPGTTIAAPAGSGAPTVCTTRTAKPALGLTLPIDVFTTFIGNLSKIGS